MDADNASHLKTVSATVITNEEIKRLGATSVSEILQITVGASVTSFGPRGSQETIGIRGSNYSQVLVLLDGKRMNSTRDSGVDLSALPVAVEDIERIEIVRGASSSLYGADAVGGVVNIITRKAAGQVSKIGGSIGSHGFDTISLGTADKTGAFGYSVSGMRETSDGYRQNSDLEQWVFGGKATYDISKIASLEFTANHVSKENGVPGSTLFPSLHARQGERDTVFGGSYQQKIGTAWDFKISAYRNQNELTYKDPDFFVDSRHRGVTRGGETRVAWLTSSWNLLTLGIETRRDSLTSTDSGEHVTSSEGMYLQDELSLGESLIVVIGDRYDKHSVYGKKSSPRASARYLISGSGTIIRASAGKSFRAPTFNDLYWLDAWSHGNPELRPESSNEYEAGIEQPFGKGNVIKFTQFRRKVTDLIRWDYMAFPMFPENIGKADIKGYEAEGMFRLSDSVVLSANYAYTNPVDEATGEKIYYTIPEKQIKGRLTVAVDTDTYISVEGRAVENYVPAGEPVWHYSVFDAKIAEKIGKKQGGEIYFGMKNIFDRKYEVARNYPMPPKEIYGGFMLPF
ncbi:MAG: TonB-dependent receptor plug domain-containing protein [Nitrospirota bacterium]